VSLGGECWHFPKFSSQNVNHFPTRNLKFPKEFIYFNLK
jgi:hypothetical protein